jgi:hypothetical protein
MKRRIAIGLLATALLLLLNGCAPQAADPLLKNEATNVPGLSMNAPAAQASTSDTEQVTATLYYRYLDEPMLASETRTLTVPHDESVEFAIVQALAHGPSAGHSDLRRLLPSDTQVESVVSRGNTLFVTFNAGFLNDEVPADWAMREDWVTEAPTLRKLIVQSIIASVTEYAPYTGVQLLVHRTDEVQTSLRLDNAYFLTGAAGLSEPLARDETLLLTPENTADILLTSWQRHNYERLYLYLTDADKPTFSVFEEALSATPALSGFSTGGGNVANDGQKAVVTTILKLTTQNGASSAYPLQLVRENGIWKLPYARLKTMMGL